LSLSAGRELPRSLPRIAPWLACGALLAAAALAFRHWHPATDAGSSICLSRRLFHLPCPGCGMTRAFVRLAQGDWRAAFALHPLAPFLGLEAVGGWLAWGAALARPRSPSSGAALELVLWGNAAALLALWLGRAATGTLPW